MNSVFHSSAQLRQQFHSFSLLISVFVVLNDVNSQISFLKTNVTFEKISILNFANAVVSSILSINQIYDQKAIFSFSFTYHLKTVINLLPSISKIYYYFMIFLCVIIPKCHVVCFCKNLCADITLMVLNSLIFLAVLFTSVRITFIKHQFLFQRPTYPCNCISN